VTAYLNRDFFLKEHEAKFQDVEVDGGTVRIRRLSTAEKGAYEASLRAKDGSLLPDKLKTFRERLMVASCVDAEGNPLFTSNDIPKLSKLPVSISDTVVDAIQILSCFKDDEMEEMENLAGN
jgi:hypothetical protein